MRKMMTAACLWLAAASGPAATAAVVITALPTPLEIHDDFFGRYDSIDVDGNGTVDYTFGSQFSFVGLRTERNNRAVITLDPPPNIGGPPFQLPVGYTVFSTLALTEFDDPLWASSDFIEGFVSPGEIAFMGIVQVFSTGSSSSFNGRGAIGIEFEAEDGIHYGFIDISAGPGYAGITLYGWAYESQPGVAIIAGQVPEPSQTVLLLGGIVFLLVMRHRNATRDPPRRASGKCD